MWSWIAVLFLHRCVNTVSLSSVIQCCRWEVWCWMNYFSFLSYLLCLYGRLQNFPLYPWRNFSRLCPDVFFTKPSSDIWAFVFWKCKSVCNSVKLFSLKAEVIKSVSFLLLKSLPHLLTLYLFITLFSPPQKKQQQEVWKHCIKFSFSPGKS